jgi:hypothetical protein
MKSLTGGRVIPAHPGGSIYADKGEGMQAQIRR